MGSFFRRLRRDKSEKAEEPELLPDERPENEDGGGAALPSEEAGTETMGAIEEPPIEPEPRTNGIEAQVAPSPGQLTPPPALVAVAPSERRAPPPIVAGPPPPLPEADTEVSRSTPRSRGSPSRCFLCGSEMDGPWCPKCRMAWND